MGSAASCRGSDGEDLGLAGHWVSATARCLKAATPNKQASNCFHTAPLINAGWAGLGLRVGFADRDVAGHCGHREEDREAASWECWGVRAVTGDRPCPRRALPYPKPSGTPCERSPPRAAGKARGQKKQVAGVGSMRTVLLRPVKASVPHPLCSVCPSRAEGREPRAREVEACSLSSSLT